MYTRLQIALFAAFVALGISFSDSSAAPRKKMSPINAKAGKGAQKAAQKSVHGSIIAELHQAKHRLDIGLHDYNGHRAKADHEIHKAIHLLTHGVHHQGVHKTNFQATPHYGQITPALQAQSDSNLRQAQKIVQAAQLQLTQLHTKKGNQHHQQAAHLLANAVQQIEQALHVVNNYNHHHKKGLALVK